MKNKHEVIEEIKEIISNAREGLIVEGESVDLKQSWYNFSVEHSKYEFLKDVCALANSSFGDGYLIIGVNENGDLFDAKFKTQSNLGDEKYLQEIIEKHIESHLKINLIEYIPTNTDKTVSIIHIPANNNKPFLIKNFLSKKHIYERIIFIRRGTTNRIATKNELDNIYRYRINFIPDIEIKIFTAASSINFYESPSPNLHYSFDLELILTIENSGSRPVSIHTLEICFINENEKKNYFGNTKILPMNTTQISTYPLNKRPINILSNQINTFHIGLTKSKMEFSTDFHDNLKKGKLKASVTASATNSNENLVLRLNYI